MRAITIQQPYASLVASGLKVIETRSWAPPLWLIGRRIAIHAGAASGRRVRDAVWRLHATWSIVPTDVSVCGRRGSRSIVVDTRGTRAEYTYPLGAVLGVVTLSAVAQVIGSASGVGTSSGSIHVEWRGGAGPGWIADDGLGDYAVGRWLWVLRDAWQIDPPIPAAGRLGIWDWDWETTL